MEEPPISRSDKKPGENRKKRRKKRSGAATPVSASGTSTPQVTGDLGGDQLPSTSATNVLAVKGFDGEDYIAFTFSDLSDDDEEGSFHVDAKGKGKARVSEGGPGVTVRGGE